MRRLFRYSLLALTAGLALAWLASPRLLRVALRHSLQERLPGYAVSLGKVDWSIGGSLEINDLQITAPSSQRLALGHLRTTFAWKELPAHHLRYLRLESLELATDFPLPPASGDPNTPLELQIDRLDLRPGLLLHVPALPALPELPLTLEGRVSKTATGPWKIFLVAEIRSWHCHPEADWVQKKLQIDPVVPGTPWMAKIEQARLSLKYEGPQATNLLDLTLRQFQLDSGLEAVIENANLDLSTECLGLPKTEILRDLHALPPVKGLLTFRRARYQKFVAEHLEAPFQLEQGLWSWKDLQVSLFSGQIQSSGQFDLCRRSMPEATAQIEHLDLGRLLCAVSPGQVEGAGFWSGTIQAKKPPGGEFSCLLALESLGPGNVQVLHAPPLQEALAQTQGLDVADVAMKELRHYAYHHGQLEVALEGNAPPQLTVKLQRDANAPLPAATTLQGRAAQVKLQTIDLKIALKGWMPSKE